MKIGLVGDSLTEGRPGVSFFNILKERFPNDTIVNLGKPGETIKSLHTRLTKVKLDTDYDLIFLWIGVNDVYSKLLSVQAQPVAKDQEEFKEYYQNVLKLIQASSNEIVVVAPAIVGENLENAPNKELKELSALVQSITTKYPNASFLDMRTIFEEHLSKTTSSEYIGTNPFRVMVDVFFYKKTKKVDELSKKRGLQLTLDGIHLNSLGAEIVAAVYESTINQTKKVIKETIQ